ncbi:hypothetical protein ACFLTE_04005, partial [Bacteroidota bacterium]
IKEGYIEYEVIYLNKEKESLYSFMLPKTMVMAFKKNRIKSSLNGFSGNFAFSTILNTKSDSSIALFQIMNQKYYYLETNKGQSELFGNLPGIKIEESKDTSVISGITCNTAYINSTQDSFAPFNISYTKNIKIHNPNKKNPFYKIDGVLLDFQVNMYNMDMRFIAKKVIERDVPDSIFQIPDEYKRINRETVDKIICMLE